MKAIRLFRLINFSFFGLLCGFIHAQNVQVEVDILANRKPVSPYLYGRNNSLSSSLLTNNPNTTISWQLLKDAGVSIFRENGGNNSTKYNWRRKISSHPDWYNNVYANDWDFAAQRLQQNIPTAQAIWAFQLIGKAAKTNIQNFGDWNYNRSQWWSGVNQNLAGGGLPNTNGGDKAAKEGDISLYLENWPADSTTGILDNWFGVNGLKLDSTKLRYWNMDNEPEIWNGTHDDVMSTQTSAEDFMQRYFAVAKLARAKFPGIKLMGPVPANEWQWYNYNNNSVTDNTGNRYSWLEFFIKRCAEEQKSTGIRLLDVVDLHFYPSTAKAEEIVQYHRVFFDKNYAYPEANGIKRTGSGGWDASLNKEYVFSRVQDWLVKYMGNNHGVTLGMTETGINDSHSASVRAVWYASMMGEFMRNEVEVFTPWTWQVGMWETLHLFSRYNKSINTRAISSNEEMVSAYSTTNATNDSMTVILINRSTNSTQNVNLTLKNYNPTNSTLETLTLSNLPSSETFVSHTQNALKKGTITASNNTASISLLPMSITAVLVNGKTVATPTAEVQTLKCRVFPNPATDQITVEINKIEQNTQLFLVDILGKAYPLSIVPQNVNGKSFFNISLKPLQLSAGIYYLKVQSANESFTTSIYLNR